MKNSYYNIGGIFFGLILTAVTTHSKAQTRNISGTVTSSNKPLSGVIISQEGSDQVTMTANNGTYTIQVSAENPILLFRHPDYAEEKITLTNQTVVNISLEQKVKGIEEVILNAGYYKVKDRERTGSIAKVSAKDIENQPVNNVLSALQGRMTGVSITQNSGVAGGGFDIKIRGRNSLRGYSTTGYDGNKPLYIVDGVPLPLVNDFNSGMTASILPYNETNPLNAINPDDIESLEVLKDADATAIYGSKGANGVILITTKRGKKEKTEVNLRTSYGLGQMTNLPKMMNLEEYTAMRKLAFANDGVAVPSNAYDINGVWNPNKTTDWQKYFVGNTSSVSDVQLGVSGGSGNTQFSVSGGHNEETTVFPGSYRYKRNNLGVSVNHTSADRRFQIGFNGTAALQDNVLPPTDFNIVYPVLAPNAPDLYTSSGMINWENNTFNNPMGPATQTFSVKTKSLNANMTSSYQFGSGFSANLNSGYSTYNSYEQKIFPKTTYNPSSNIGSSSSSLRKAQKLNESWILEPQLNYEKRLEKHQFSALVGASFQEQKSDNIVILGRNFPSDDLLTNMAAAASITVPSASESLYRYQAVYARLNYGYNKRYFLNLTGRRDGSSRFGSERRYANFGAVGAAWLFSEEKPFKDRSWLSFGKLRTSYGIAGNDQIGDYQYYDTYQSTGGSYGGNSGLVPQRLYNKNFGWELTRKFEAALEMGLFKERLNLNIGYYHNTSSNQLVGIPMPATVGFSSIQANLDATVRNRGLEVSVESVPVKTKHWKWTTSLNFTLPENHLMKFPNLDKSTYASRFEIGKSISLVKLYQYTGIDPVTGLYTFYDTNQDGKINTADRTVSKEIKEYWYGGLQNSIQYKNWSFDLLLQFVSQSQYNVKSMYGNIGNMSNMPAIFTDYWTPGNPDAEFQKPSAGYNTAAATASSLFLLSDATVSDSFTVRVKNATLSYRIPSDSNGKLKARLFISGQNLFVFSSYKEGNPEFMAAGYTSPLRVVSFGLSLTY
ncbi:SusC/RagA family TonB-linked outer membrane protein [Epilithonimonas arachidiradicis]|uniref:TonB-linked SusC/RagA family outer membrane protein n=2 Tax=Epilithonimonas arachidiradicis TaxID=1617282 RepID=A0A420D821_9FLAO|nr:SusC/RagA family TonB-linked outer membrane protein [Epilithonimonas arachidiradicis]RKE86675.1 TonB-linked SusC/RagA family outer membrane protein [Epilithonimonas arachidiradicis]